MKRKLLDVYADCDWPHSDSWERDAAINLPFIPTESIDHIAISQRADEMFVGNPANAIGIYRQAADAGSVYSMERLGWQFWTGTGVTADTSVALKYYGLAIERGSLPATIAYARILFQSGRHDEAQAVLENGVEANFIPSYFWLGWLRYLQSKTAKARKEARPLLEHAARNGHPAAKTILSLWMARGQLGLVNVPLGWKWMVEEAIDFASRRA